jgi:flagellar protein FliS
MFSANSGKGSSAYHNVGVESIAETAAPHQLVLMLFNGARAAVAEAKGHLDRNEVAAKGGAISKAISIIDGGLKASLDLNVGG